MTHFVDDYVCFPDQPHKGFTSFDNFFTRQLREGARPIASPNDDSVIVNACESVPFKIQENVKARDKFWIKTQNYSVYHMLNGDPIHQYFVGGTVYQAYLSALSYHRWHSPISGKILKVETVPGTYFAETLQEGALHEGGPDLSGPDKSQGFLSAVATRLYMLIESKNPAIGIIALVFIGMAEVSSTESTVYEGQTIKKGDQLGMFHFGGSTYCMLFGPHLKVEWDLHNQYPVNDPLISEPANIKVLDRLATVVDLLKNK